MTALGIALGYYAALSPWFANLGFTVLYRPLIAGTLVGWLLGDPLTGMQVGAAINVLYLGWIGAGGHLPGDAALAGYLGTALALLGPLPPLAVLPLVVPISFAGGLLWLARMRAGVHFARWTDRMLSQPPPASKAQVVARLFLTHVLLPQLLLLLLTLLPVGLAAAWLLPPLARFLATLPPLPLPGGPYDPVRRLERAGGLLTAVGIALGMRNLFRRPFVAHFLLGFLFSVLGQHRLPGDVGLLALAGLALALLPPIPDGPAPSEAETAPEHPAPEVQPPPPPLRRPRRLTWGDLRCSWLFWLFFSHANYNWERLQGTGFAWAMVPIHRRLQPDGETMAAALRRHTGFFNTQPDLGSVILGVVARMEEERAEGAPVSEESVEALKRGLMGPLAGLGDTLQQAILIPTLLALSAMWAQERHWVGVLLYTAGMAAFVWGGGWALYRAGYRRGREAVLELLRGRRWQHLITGGTRMGNFLLGALVPRFVLLQLPPTLTVGGRPIQPLLDGILPGLLPLLLTLALWWLIARRRISPLRCIGGLTLLGLLLGA